MPLQLIQKLKTGLHQQASRMAYNSMLYGWSLGGSAPDRLLFSPCDIWPGNADHARTLIHEGVFTLGGDRLELHNANWHPKSASPCWINHIHSFDWLRDLRTLGGDAGRMGARAMVDSWMDHHHGWHELYWRPDILGRRVANWIAAYNFFGDSADNNFQDKFFASLIRQVRHLGRSVPGTLSGLPLLYALRGLTYAGLTLEGREACLELALNILDREISKQILSDGGPVSRNPAHLLETIRILIDIRSALRQGGYPPLASIQLALDRAVPALRFFRHGDRRFALFNGTQEGDDESVKTVLMQSGSRAKSLNSLPHTGFERIAQGKALLIMDTGKAPTWPFDEGTHGAPLAFELSYGRERVFVNCGTHPTSEDWQDAMRFTPAHNTVTIDNRNACEMHKDGSLGRKPRKVMANREDLDGACLIEACHDGYVPLNGITHRRRLFMADQGHDIRGEETLTCSVGLGRSHDIAVRFHLHPSVPVSLVQDGHEALLRLSSGPGWRFTAQGGTLSLENSVYLGEGVHPRKTKQLVITSNMTTDTTQIKWALQLESL